MSRGAQGGAEPDISRHISWIAPPADLSHLVHTFYTVHVASGGIDEHVPAYSAQLCAVAKGTVELGFGASGPLSTGPFFLKAPQLDAGRIRISAPLKAACASLTPLGWAALTALPADEVHDCEVPATAFAAADIQRSISDWAAQANSGSATLGDGIPCLEALLRNAPHPIKPRHREFVDSVTEWLGSELNPPLADLHGRLALSERQIQRLSRQFFGASPTQVLKRHRAIRAAMLLSNPALPQSLHDELGVAYFDQAHMIRDIRRFTGRTPADFALRSFAQQSLDPAGHGETAIVLTNG